MSSPAPATIGPRVRSIREAKSMTQRDLSYASGVTITTISAIELQKVSPKLDTVAALARALDVSIDTLISFECVAA